MEPLCNNGHFKVSLIEACSVFIIERLSVIERLLVIGGSTLYSYSWCNSKDRPRERAVIQERCNTSRK